MSSNADIFVIKLNFYFILFIYDLQVFCHSKCVISTLLKQNWNNIDCFQTGLPLAEKTDSPGPKHKVLFVGLDTKFLKINQPSCNIFKCLCFETHSAVWHSSGRDETTVIYNYNNTSFNNMDTGWPVSSRLLGGARSMLPPFHTSMPVENFCTSQCLFTPLEH